MRLVPARPGAIASATFLTAALLWVVLARPAAPPAVLLGWAGVAAGAGLLVPGAANQLTLARAQLAAPALVYSQHPSTFGLLALVVSVAGLSDLLDGFVARRLERPSQLGGGLDPVVDGVFFGAVALGLALGGAYPAWLAVVVIARYAVPAAAGAILLVARPGSPPQLRHTFLGQLATAMIAVLLGGLALLRGLGLETGAWLAASEVVIPPVTVGAFANLGWVALRRPPAG